MSEEDEIYSDYTNKLQNDYKDNNNYTEDGQDVVGEYDDKFILNDMLIQEEGEEEEDGDGDGEEDNSNYEILGDKNYASECIFPTGVVDKTVSGNTIVTNNSNIITNSGMINGYECDNEYKLVELGRIDSSSGYCGFGILPGGQSVYPNYMQHGYSHHVRHPGDIYQQECGGYYPVQSQPVWQNDIQSTRCEIYNDPREITKMGGGNEDASVTPSSSTGTSIYYQKKKIKKFLR